MGLAFTAGNSWRTVKGKQVAVLTFTSVQEAASKPGHSHYRRLRPAVISCLHLVTPGAPSSITGQCLVPIPPSSTTSQPSTDFSFCLTESSITLFSQDLTSANTMALKECAPAQET